MGIGKTNGDSKGKTDVRKDATARAGSLLGKPRVQGQGTKGGDDKTTRDKGSGKK